jgi:hypothetical protein
VQDRYGDVDVLDFRDIDQPVPKDDEVLVEVRAAGLHRGDWHIMTGLPYLIRVVVRLTRLAVEAVRVGLRDLSLEQRPRLPRDPLEVRLTARSMVSRE